MVPHGGCFPWLFMPAWVITTMSWTFTNIKKIMKINCWFLESHSRNGKSKAKMKVEKVSSLLLRISFGSGEADQFGCPGIIDRPHLLFSGHVPADTKSASFPLDFPKAFAKPPSFCLLTCWRVKLRFLTAFCPFSSHAQDLGKVSVYFLLAGVLGRNSHQKETYC